MPDLSLPILVEIPEPGDVVIYTSPANLDLYALVIQVYMQVGLDLRKRLVNIPCVNVVTVSPNPDAIDCCGRTIERVIHVIHMLGRELHGNYWRWPDEMKI